MDAPPIRLYPRGTYLCVVSQNDPSTLLLCQTCTVVTTHSITIPVIWLKESVEAGLFRPSFKAIIPTTSILEEVKVVKREKDLVEVDQSQIPRLRNLAMMDAIIEATDQCEKNESVCISGIANEIDVVKTETDAKETEPCIQEVISPLKIKLVMDCNVDLVERNMFISFNSLGHMDSFNELIKDKPHPVQQVLKMKKYKEVNKTSPPMYSNYPIDKPGLSSTMIHTLVAEILNEIFGDVVELDRTPKTPVKNINVTVSGQKKQVDMDGQKMFEVRRGSGAVHEEPEKQHKVAPCRNKIVYPDDSKISNVNKKVSGRMKQVDDISGQKMFGKRMMIGIVHEEHWKQSVQVPPCRINIPDTMQTNGSTDVKKTVDDEFPERFQGHSHSDNHALNVEYKLDSNENLVSDQKLVDNSTKKSNTKENRGRATKKSNAKRCGYCDVCVRDNCGRCLWCLDMSRFGGRGKQKQCCMERICLNMYPDNDDIPGINVKVSGQKREVDLSVEKRRVSQAFQGAIKKQREAVQVNTKKIKIEYPDVNDINDITDVKRVGHFDIPERFQGHSHTDDQSLHVQYMLDCNENMVSAKKSNTKENRGRATKKSKAKRCGYCGACVRDNCGLCLWCLDMSRFGGRGKQKQCCVERICPNMYPDDDDIPVKNVKVSGHKEVDMPLEKMRVSWTVQEAHEKQREAVQVNTKKIKIEYPDVNDINEIIDVKRVVNFDIPERFQVHPHSENHPYDISVHEMVGQRNFSEDL